VILVLATTSCGNESRSQGTDTATNPVSDTATSGSGPSTNDASTITSSVVITNASASDGTSALRFVAFGDSWPAGGHCNGCTTFVGLWAADIEAQTGRQVELTDRTGKAEDSYAESKSSASLLESLTLSDRDRAAVQNADIILIATGPNEIEPMMEAAQDGTCGGADQLDCIRALGQQWQSNFNAILRVINNLRAGKPTAIRLVNAANPFLSVPDMNQGMPEGFANNGGALTFELLTAAICDAATEHNAVCVDVRPILNGPNLDQPVDENSTQSMRAVANALGATGLKELE